MYPDNNSPFGPTVRRSALGIVIPVLLAGLMVAVLLISRLLTAQQALEFTDEGGIVEKLTVFAYLAAAGLVLAAGAWRGNLTESFVLSVPLSLLALREMDFHVRFTTMGIFKTRYYLAPEVSYLEKIVVIAILAMLLWVGIWFLRLFGHRFLASIRNLHPGAISVLIAASLLIFSKAIDGIARKLFDVGVEMRYEAMAIFHTIEEVCELGAPLLLIAAAATLFYPRVSEP